MILNNHTISEEVETFENKFFVNVSQHANILDFNQFNLNNFMFINNIFNLQESVSMIFTVDGIEHEIVINKENLTFDRLIGIINVNDFNIVARELNGDNNAMLEIYHVNGDDFTLTVPESYQYIFGNVEKIDFEGKPEYISQESCNIAKKQILKLRSDIEADNFNNQVISYINLQQAAYGEIIEYKEEHNEFLNPQSEYYFELLFLDDSKPIFQCEQQFLVKIEFIKYSVNFAYDIFLALKEINKSIDQESK